MSLSKTSRAACGCRRDGRCRPKKRSNESSNRRSTMRSNGVASRGCGARAVARARGKNEHGELLQWIGRGAVAATLPPNWERHFCFQGPPADASHETRHPRPARIEDPRGRQRRASAAADVLAVLVRRERRGRRPRSSATRRRDRSPTARPSIRTTSAWPSCARRSRATPARCIRPSAPTASPSRRRASAR